MTRILYASLICKSVNPSSKGVPAVRHCAPVGAVLVVPLRALDGPRRASMPDANLTKDRHGGNLPRRGKMNRFGRRVAYSGTKVRYDEQNSMFILPLLGTLGARAVRRETGVQARCSAVRMVLER